MNLIIKVYFKTFINWDQKNWARLCPFAQLVIKNRDVFSIKMNLFFFQYGYNVDIL